MGGIFENVAGSLGEIAAVADQVIVVLALPEFARASSKAIGLCCGEGFPRVEDARKCPLAARLHDGMHMVRHDAPREYAIAPINELPECFGHKCGDIRAAEVTSSRAGIE